MTGPSRSAGAAPPAPERLEGSEVLAGLERAAPTPALEAALRDFDRWWLHHVRTQERALFPALIEAMAGSDAVCLHEMAERARLEHGAIAALRRRLEPFGEDSPSLAAALIGECRRHLAHEAAELVPMSERLLDASEVEVLARALG